MGRPSNDISCTLPHPDHFDATKYGPNGQRLRGGKPAPIGKPSKLTAEEGEQALWLEKLANAAAKDLREFLESKGYKSTCTRTTVLKKLREGWRPKR